jgi:hypothetical protein
MGSLTKVAQSKDFLSGVIFLLLGVVMVMEATNYPFGSLLRMGPGFFPTIIGILLAAVGAALIGKAVITQADDLLEFAVRPAFFITGALLAFAYTLQELGLVIATFLLVASSRLAFRPPRLLGAFVLSAVLVLVAILIFGYLLRLPLRLWP